jgi:hypothetical protein
MIWGALLQIRRVICPGRSCKSEEVVKEGSSTPAAKKDKKWIPGSGPALKKAAAAAHQIDRCGSQSQAALCRAEAGKTIDCRFWLQFWICPANPFRN